MRIPPYIIILTALLIAACNSGERQRRLLEELERQNHADSLMINDSLARDLADWFDRYGTPNEQLRAYYILGRTYADRGETPQALNAYYDAIDRADTTRVDCNYHKLCRIYSQMSDIFYRQNLVSNQALCLDKAISYAYLSNDTVAALTLYAHKILPYDKLGWNDSIISVCEQTYKAFCKLGYPQIGSQYYSYAVSAYTIKGDYARARHCMDIYEQESGYFDNYGNIEAGREVYYAIKGDFYQAIGKYDSAEYYYRKELTNGLDYNNQTLASKGLATLFMQIHQPDSAAFYAAYAFNMNDSNYAQMSTTDVERIQTAYNYSHQQQLAQTEKKRADRERKLLLWLAIALLLTLVLGGTIVYTYKKRRKTALKAYKEKVRELETLQTDTLYLRSHEKELDSLLTEKEIKIEQLKREIDANKDKEKIKLEARKKQLTESAIYAKVQKMANTGNKLSEEDWHQINRLVIELLPNFYSMATDKKFRLSLNEYRVFTLIRLHIPPKPISNLMGVSPQYISKVIRNASYKIYQESINFKSIEQRLSDFF